MKKQKKKWEQFNLFELMGIDVPAEKEAEECFLKKKITSLKRDYVPHMQDVNSVLEIGYSGYEKQKKRYNASPGEYLRKRIISKIIKPRMEEGKEDEILGFMEGLDVEILPDKYSLKLHEPVKTVRISEDGELVMEVPAVVGISYIYHYGHTKSGKVTILSYEFLLAELIMYCQAKKFFAEVHELPREERDECIPVAETIRYIKRYVNESCRINADFPSWMEGELRQGIDYLGFSLSEEKGACYSNGLYGLMIAIATGRTSYLLLRTEGKRCYEYALDHVFYAIACEYVEIQADKKMAERVSGDYASSFETKKNIPKRTLDAMEHSMFHQFFGYVELDEDADTEKVEQIAAEYGNLAEFLGIKKLQEYSIRFRKLGKHRAAGLYFPAHKCLCVDLDNPNSLPHELWHLLDYRNGRLSLTDSFSHVWKLYVDALDMEIVKCGKEKEMRGKGKYNRSYYASKTETFARCGEIYLSRICGMENSIVSGAEISGFAYPDTDELNKAIGEYFEKILKKGV